MRRDASVDELAHRAGLSKALVYRAFDSKEEIFVLTLTDYLGELATRLQTPPDGGPVDELRAVSTVLRRVLPCSTRPSSTAQWH